MRNHLAIQLCNGPMKDLVRIHTEHTDSDRPDVRYIRRRTADSRNTLPFRNHDVPSPDEIVLAIGKVYLRIHADEEQVRIAFCEAPLPPQAA
jgi:hypothetical protein